MLIFNLEQAISHSFARTCLHPHIISFPHSQGDDDGGKKGAQPAASPDALTVPLIHALVRPFGNCYELLTQRTVERYLLPIVDIVPK